MRYAGIIYDDTAAAPGLCVSFYTQGCPIHCVGCHNPGTWDENGGYEFAPNMVERILNAISRNGIQRNFAILGGEPLSPHNLFLTAMLVQIVREHYPDIQIWIWSGYNLQDLLNTNVSPHLRIIFNNIDALVAGPFVQELRDITLPYRGSSNQKVFLFDHTKKICYNKENEKEEYSINV